MSTRAVIGRETEATGPNFEGVYHHWDGYPTGLGYWLWRIPECDRDEFIEFVFQHTAGFSTVVNCDWRKPPAYRELGVRHKGEPPHTDTVAHALWESTQGAQCYCHGDRHESPEPLMRRSDGPQWCEWAYIFTGRHNRDMRVYAREDNSDSWRLVATVRHDTAGADTIEFWEAIEKLG